METDQFTTPKGPLEDIGPNLSQKVVEIVESDRTGDLPEHILYKWVGRNIFASRVGGWIKNIRSERPVRYRPNVFRSIYGTAFSPFLVAFFFDSPTVDLYGYYMGTDKIDHFFQQGHQYAEMVLKREREGADGEEAIAAAVAHGVKQEHTYLGTMISGVYSNGDLAANYAGMKFYLNLGHSVRIGQRLLPPLFERSTQGWRLRPGVDPARILEPFISNHLDESLNPSRYRFSRGSIASRIRARCDQWITFYADRLYWAGPPGQSFAKTWFGEDYGHWLPPKEEVSVSAECEIPR